MNKQDIKKTCKPIIKSCEENIRKLFLIFYKRLVDTVGKQITEKNAILLPLDDNTPPYVRFSIDVVVITEYGCRYVYYDFDLRQWYYTDGGGIVTKDLIYKNKYITKEQEEWLACKLLSLLLGCTSIESLIEIIDSQK